MRAFWYDSDLFMARNTSCHFGAEQGHWMHEEWHTFSPDAKCGLKQYFKPTEVPRAASRLVVDPLLAGRSVLLIGDSTDRNKLLAFCNAGNVSTEAYIYGLPKTPQRTRDYNYCTAGNFTMAHFMHWGVMGQPYWYMAFTGSPLHSTTEEHLASDAVLFRDHVLGGHDPTLVIVQSYAWDIGAMCQRNKTQTLNQCHFDVQNWIARAVTYVERVQQTFPKSVIMWRTSHAYNVNWSKLWRVSQLQIHEMNAAARWAFPRLGVGLVEWGPMMESYGMPWVCQNQLHVTPECNLPYVNLVLNIISRELA